MTERSCQTCKHVTASPSPCGGCVFSKELPKWEPRLEPRFNSSADAGEAVRLGKAPACGSLGCHVLACADCFPPMTATEVRERRDHPMPPMTVDMQQPKPVVRVTVSDVSSGGLDGTGKENPKARYGRSKPQLGLLPAAALIEMAGAMELGAAKYGASNWRDDPVETMTYIHAALRHVLSFIDGEDIDPESGSSHLAHAMACLGIVIDAGRVSALIDNRPTKGRAGELIREKTKAVA